MTSTQTHPFDFPSRKFSLGIWIVFFHLVSIYFFIIYKHPHGLEEPTLRTELRFITTTPIAIQVKSNPRQEPHNINAARIVKQPMEQSATTTQLPTLSTRNTANDTRITAPDFDEMLEQQKQQRQQSQQLNIDHGQLAKEIESKGQRTLEFAPKASETALQKLNKGYDRAGPYVEYESKSYTSPDGSRVTKVISNKGTSCMRANRPHDRIDNRGPRVWKLEC